MKPRLVFSGALASAVVAVLFLSPTPAVYGQNCKVPDMNRQSGEWAKAYASWCECMGGTFDADKGQCLGVSGEGSRTRRRSKSQMQQEIFKQQSAEAAEAAAATGAEVEAEGERAEAERKLGNEEARARDAERQRKAKEQQKRSQEEFERNKEKTLRDMNAIARELGLTRTDESIGLNSSDEADVGLGLKDAIADTATRPGGGCTWGDQGPHVVDLRCLGLDPDKPIAVDPHVARGEERVFPAQIDPATFENRSYNDGFAALMRTTFSVADAADAVAKFRAARADRPNDPLVRNALLLAQDILAGREQHERELQSSAALSRLQAYAALMAGDTAAAKGHIALARKLDPRDTTTQFLESFAAVEGRASDPQRRDAYRLVANSLAAIRRQSNAAAVRMLQEAQRLQPNDTFITSFLSQLQKYEIRSGT